MFHINIEELKHIDKLFKLLFSLLPLNITFFHSFPTISFFYIHFLPSLCSPYTLQSSNGQNLRGIAPDMLKIRQASLKLIRK